MGLQWPPCLKLPTTERETGQKEDRSVLLFLSFYFIFFGAWSRWSISVNSNLTVVLGEKENRIGERKTVYCNIETTILVSSPYPWFLLSAPGWGLCSCR